MGDNDEGKDMPPPPVVDLSRQRTEAGAYHAPEWSSIPT